MSRAAGEARPALTVAAPDRYLERSESPLTSLVFLLPLIIAYEVGTEFFTAAAHHGRDQHIIAFTLLQRFLHLFGATGRHLPALAVIGVLLAWHIACKDPWRIDFRTLMLMAVESAAMAMPLIVLGYALARYFPLAAHGRGASDLLIMAFGAGIYEEYFFRLALFTILSLVLRDLFKMGKKASGLLIVVVSAFLFSAYHYLSPVEHFVWRTAFFRTAAGIYFGLLFLARGFGITAASHCSYDIIVSFL